ncbi:hypothetical protein DUZ99_16080 [Xylanibacillus composti]|uniref:Uncharacterized protein n=1 Tax=Xylanibacillus composti TaxID=1572762 RepID=A0A8J4H5I6_9BACL|nr:hypothetical protein [Xylanibacillus composti]MDT9726501.1 hypothetical protein [Xylanibacillus composti]GIQ69927.1 hypothetical protein XYCOK13_27510 [Xylanibacillus composti]
MRECIIHFKLIRENESKMLRTLLYLPKDRMPEIADFIRAFEEMGYPVKLVNERELIFDSLDGGKPFKLDITKIEVSGEEKDEPDFDMQLRAILEHLIRK